MQSRAGGYSVTQQPIQRGRLTRVLWWLMWLTWLGFLIQKAADVERSSGNGALVGLLCAPLSFFLWAALKESLRLLIWYELVLLFYFISSVEAAFAYQADWLSAAGLILVVINFTVCMLYIRYRGRESRPVTP